MENQLVVFDLANEYYGVDIGAVENIIELQPINAASHVPGFVEGIADLRGTALPVVDLRKRFGLPVEEATKETRIIVIEIDGTLVGMMVDAVPEVLRVPEEAIEPLPPIVLTVDSTFITGIAKIDERLIILLDLSRVLSPEEQVSLHTFAQDQAEDNATLAET
jgi:purine-binding chemotaxis protein CheW